MEVNNSYSNGDTMYNQTTGDVKQQLQSLKEEHSYQKEIKAMEIKHSEVVLEKELGKIGKLFGGNHHAARNITITIVFILLLVVGFLSSIAYFYNYDKEFALSIIKDVIPVVTLALGYMFGKK